MQAYPEETSYARRNLKSKPYREQVEKLEAELHALADELTEAKISILEDEGYEPIQVDGVTLMVPEGMQFEQLFTAFQQIPPTLDDQHKLTYLVAAEDRQKISDADVHQEIVDRRQDIVDQITSVYTDFWQEIVQDEADNDTEAIVYMLAGLNRRIDATVLSEITDIQERRCRGFTFDEDGIVIEDDG